MKKRSKRLHRVARSAKKEREMKRERDQIRELKSELINVQNELLIEREMRKEQREAFAKHISLKHNELDELESCMDDVWEWANRNQRLPDTGGATWDDLDTILQRRKAKR